MRISEMVKHAELSDREIFKALDLAKKALKAGESKAYKARHIAIQRVFQSFLGTDDVEKAARENAIKRIERDVEEALAKVRRAYNKKLEKLRSQAGQWIDLIPKNINLNT